MSKKFFKEQVFVNQIENGGNDGDDYELDEEQIDDELDDIEFVE